MTSTSPTRSAVDPEELDRQIAEMYRDVASEADRDLGSGSGMDVLAAALLPSNAATAGTASQ